VQVPAAQLRWLDPADDSLESKSRVIEDDLDRLHAFSGSLRDHATATDELGQIRTQGWMQVLTKPRGEAATLAWREAEPRVRSDSKLDAATDDFAIAAGVSPVVAPRRQRVRGFGGRLRLRSENGGLEHPRTPIA